MNAFEFWKTVTHDEANFVENVIHLLKQEGISFCVIGGQGVNAYAEPVVSLDLHLVIAAEDTESAIDLLAAQFEIERFPHSINVRVPDSQVRVQIQTDPRYGPFCRTAEEREALGLMLPVARIEHILQGKVWAATDSERRPSKRQKDLADIARLLEVKPELRSDVPGEVLDRLVD
jgi:hypothetical protein